MVVARAVRIARGKTRVIGDQARKRAKGLFDLLDIHPFVHENLTNADSVIKLHIVRRLSFLQYGIRRSVQITAVSYDR